MVEREITLTNVIDVVKRRFWILLSLYLVAGIIGYGVASLIPKEYRLVGIVKLPYSLNIVTGERSLVVNPDEMKAIVESLQNMIKNRRFTELSKLLNVRVDVLRTITRISTEGISDKATSVKVVIEGKDPRALTSVKTGLIDFLKGLPIVRKRIKKEKENLTKSEELYERLLAEKSEADSKKGNYTIVLDERQAQVMAARELQKIRFLLLNISNFKLVFSSGTPTRPFKPRKLFFAIGFFMLSVFLSFFLILFWAYRIEAGEEK